MIDRFLARVLDDESRETVIGDLHEGFAEIRMRRGPLAAWWWYVVHGVRSMVTCRITGARTSTRQLMDADASVRPTLWDLLRPALRQFRDYPLYSIATAGTLALAVGATGVSVTVAKRALLDPLPYRDDDRIVSILTLSDGMASAVSPHVWQDLQASASPLTEFAPIRPSGGIYSTAGGTETLGLSSVHAGYFDFLGVRPSLGRVWTPQEPDAVVVSAAFWRDKLGRRADVIDSAITVDGVARRVVGVMPEGFTPPYFWSTEAWVPLDTAALLADLRARRTLTLLARRAPEATQQDVDAYLAAFSRQTRDRFPREHANQSWIARPLRDELVGPAGAALAGIAGASVLLLGIVAANIAGLATAHTVAIRHHLAVRAALGATRSRLFVDQLVNTLVLAFVGSIAGVSLALALTRIVARYQASFLPRLEPITAEVSVAALGMAAGMIVGVAAALVPRGIMSLAPFEVLRSARGSSADAKVTLTRSSLVVVQVAMALVLMIGAGLLVRTVQHLSERDLGFVRDGLAWVQVTLPGQRYQAHERQLQFERDVLERVQQVRGVKSVTASVGYPLWGGMMAGLTLKADPPGTPRREVAYLSVSPNFTRDVGARIVAGRDLLPSDDFGATRAVVINETMARMFWPNGDAIGSEVQIGAGAPTDRWITVVGIMADMRAHGLTSDIRPTAFGSTLQYSWPRRHIGVRLEGPPAATFAQDLKAAIHAVDPAVAIGAVTLAEQNLSDAMARHRLVMLALAVFGGIAVVLCISGLYAVIALNSQQRRREYAIRLALGARAGSVRWMVVRQGLMLGALGAAFGVAGAAVGTRALQGLLHGVQATDGATFVAACAALLVLATFAAWQPARQAERVSPVEALRAE